VVQRRLLRVALGSAVMAMASGCRVGYDELAQLALGAGGSSSSGASGGASSGAGSGAGGSANGSGAGEAGEPGAGGTSGADGGTTSSGGTAGSVANGGSSTGGTGASGGDSGAAGDATGGMGATGGAGGAGASGGAGGNGGVGGSSGSSASGGAGGAAGAGASAGGISGAGGAGAGGSSGAGGAGAGGAGAGGSSGAAGGGGYAGATSLGDCVTQTFNAHDYAFCNVLASWTGARDSCATIGMQLARIDSDPENVWLFDNLYDSPPQTGMWIGATDAAVEGEWRWVDGTLFWLGDENGSAQNGLYDAWFFLTQPSAQSSIRDCGVLDQGSVGWYDSDCTLQKVFVCESL
jgi:hypothetical protein